MLSMITNMIKQAYLSLAGSDSDNYPVAQATANDKASKFVVLGTYGICANPTKDSHVLLFNSQGQESVKFGIVNDYINRKKDLLEGEVVLYNTKTESYVFLKEDGSIEISGSEIKINEGDDFAVKFDLLDAKLQELVSAINTALSTKKDEAGTAGSLSLDISSAKSETIKIS